MPGVAAAHARVARCGAHSARTPQLASRAASLRASARAKPLRVPVAHAARDERTRPVLRDWVGNIATFAVWSLAVYYLNNFAPNEAPERDQEMVKQLLGLGDPSAAPVNPILFSIFWLMGVYPCIFASLAVPSFRSANKVPVWPFIILSIRYGLYGIGPYFFVWQPITETQISPPPSEELDKFPGGFFMRGLESRWFPAFLLVSSVGLIGNAAFASATTWDEYRQLFGSSYFANAMSIDFLVFILLMPYFVWFDASQRKIGEENAKTYSMLALLMAVGPCAYLLQRPVAEKD